MAKKKEERLDWTTEDEIQFLDSLRIRQRTSTLKKYEKEMSKRVNWMGGTPEAPVEMNKGLIREWLLENA
jgi:hypothetical protein